MCIMIQLELIFFFLTELIKIYQLFLHYYKVLVLLLVGDVFYKGQVISIIYDALRFSTDNLFTIVHNHLSLKRHFCIVSRALRIHVK